jgi:hypothetical protein
VLTVPNNWEEVECELPARADAIQNHVSGDFEQHDPRREHLLANVELALRDADIFYELVGDGVGDVVSVEFCIAERERQELVDSERLGSKGRGRRGV